MTDEQNCTLDLINRQKEKIKEFDGKLVIQQGMIDYQKAEIERYKGVIKILENDVANAKYKAIKGFAERLKEEMRLDDDCKYDCAQCHYDCKDYIPFIDNLEKEMTEVEKQCK